MTIPRATVRLQLHRGFTLIDASRQIPYYSRLGVSHVYLSPISHAVSGSTHGYDVIDPGTINPELGGEAAFMELAGCARKHDMGIILDIVPNHMATHCTNRWWWDVLRLGPRSAYAEWFDIDWLSPDLILSGKVLVPFLVQNYASSLDTGKLSLIFDQGSQSFQIQAEGARYPLAPDSLRPLDVSIAQTLAHHDPGTLVGRERLHALLQRQHYVLAWWRCAADCINWRRFFEISALIGLRVEQPAVFDAVHALPLRLFAQGLVDGLRIDHVDGLAQPLAYCRRLKAQLEARSTQRPGALRHDEPWLIVEKILGHDEVLDSRWTAHGTTGYDFMDQVGALLHDPTGEVALSTHWNTLSRQTATPQELLEDARRLMLDRHFVAEYCALLRALSHLAQSRVATRDWTRPAIDRVLQVLLIVFPVYRTYIEEGEGAAADFERCATVIEDVRRRLAQQAAGAECELLDTLAGWLSIVPPSVPEVDGDVCSPLQREVINRFQQLTPPLAAKSLEDTAFYRYGRLLSRNEVGSSLDKFALPPESFHRRNAWRAEYASQSMLATATHDQKRGEDVRARLAVVSQIPDVWIAASQRWLQGLDTGALHAAPCLNAERYMLLQTLVGAWPLDLAVDDSDGLERYTERVVQWQIKAQREAKLSSSWFEPNLSHEQAGADDVRRLMLGAHNDLRTEIEQFVRRIAPAGAVNSFAQIILRMTVPGVPDLYQGTEFWDFSLVDPDNRRPVDYSARHQTLDMLQTEGGIHGLMANWRNGHIKQAIVARLLQLRQALPDVFARGRYTALPLVGPHSAHALGFLRLDGEQAVLVVVPRLCAEFIGAGQDSGLPLISPEFWANTYAILPAPACKRVWRNTLTGASLDIGSDARLPLEEVLAQLPVAVLCCEHPS